MRWMKGQTRFHHWKSPCAPVNLMTLGPLLFKFVLAQVLHVRAPAHTVWFMQQSWLFDLPNVAVSRRLNSRLTPNLTCSWDAHNLLICKPISPSHRLKNRIITKMRRVRFEEINNLLDWRKGIQTHLSVCLAYLRLRCILFDTHPIYMTIFRHSRARVQPLCPIH